METPDFSKEIFEKYFGIDSPVVVITLQDETELSGKLTGFFHDDPDDEGSFIARWHFISEAELNETDLSTLSEEEPGIIILQKDIKHIRYKSSS